jgi:hypothetical protein
MTVDLLFDGRNLLFRHGISMAAICARPSQHGNFLYAR